jgi:hypothetical protein
VHHLQMQQQQRQLQAAEAKSNVALCCSPHLAVFYVPDPIFQSGRPQRVEIEVSRALCGQISVAHTVFPPTALAMWGSRELSCRTLDPAWPDPGALWCPRRGAPGPRGTNSRRHRKDFRKWFPTPAREIAFLWTKMRSET